MKYLNFIVSKSSMLSIMSAVVAVISLAGCQKWSHNGDIDGQWQVMQVYYSDVAVEFPKGERFYYNFYLHTVQLGLTGSRPHGLEGNMIYEGTHLSLEFPYVRDGQLPEKWSDKLVYWGVPVSGEINATIQELTSSRLVFGYDDVVVVCRKF